MFPNTKQHVAGQAELKGRNVRALVIVAIDDDLSFREMLEDFLVSEDHEVQTWPELQGAAEMIRDCRPDLVILDLWLGRGRDGEAGGWLVLQELRGHPDTLLTPVILCSADADALENYRNVVTEDAGVTCLDKPFELDDLSCLIRRMVDFSAGNDQ